MKSMSGKKCGNARAIRNIALFELKGRKASKLVEPRLLQSRIVIGVKVVKPDHRPALLQEPARHMVADKTRGAGDEDGIKVGSHKRCLMRSLNVAVQSNVTTTGCDGSSCNAPPTRVMQVK